MLQNIRDNLQGTIAKVIIVLIAIPFAVFGIDAFFTGGVPEVARVNGVAITEPELSQAIELQRRRLLAQEEKSVDPQTLEESRLRGPALDALIDRLALRQVAERSGFRVGDAMLDRIILDDESFRENGTFSQQRFQGILASNGMSPGYYRNLLREELLINQVLSGIAASEFVTPAELREVTRITQQTVDVRYLQVPVDTTGAPPAVPEERLQSYFDANPDEFRTDETVSVDYLELRLEDLFKAVPEEELRREYERRVAGFEAADERHAAHIMFSSLGDDEAKARLAELRERIVKGEDFAALARDNSEDIGSAAGGGDLGYSAGDAFPAEFEAALAALKPGEVSQPLRTDSGWHIVKLLDLREQSAPTFEELRSEIELALQKQAAEPLFVERSEQLADLTFNSEGLAEAAKSLELEIERGPEISRRGGEGLFADARLIAAAFSDDVLTNGQNSELLELDAEHVVVLRLYEHKPARKQELAEVRERIVTLLTEAIRREQARARAERVLGALQGGNQADIVAGAEGLQWQLVPGYRRGAQGLPPEVSEAVFSTPRANGSPARSVVVLASGDVVVFETTNFVNGDIAQLPPEQQSTMRGILAQSRGRAVSAHYGERLRESADLEML